MASGWTAAAKAIQAKSGTEYKYILNTVVTTAEQSQEYRIYYENDFEGYTKEQLEEKLAAIPEKQAEQDKYNASFESYVKALKNKIAST